MKTDLTPEFQKLKTILKEYEDTLKSKNDSEEKFDLWSLKEIEILGKKRNEINFVTIQIQGSFIGFYFMPIYVNPTIATKLGQDLLKLLKGKSCFHIKSIDKNMEQQISSALKIGFEYYKEQGFV